MGNVTIKDVAKAAGVSITTVSFVLNRRSDMVISQAVQKKVLEAAEKLDYHPSALAAGLAGKRTRNLGVIFYLEGQPIANNFYSFIIEGIVKETLAQGFNIYFSYMESVYKGYPTLPKIVREKNVDGILVLGRCDPKMAADMKKRKIPVVAIDNFPDLKGVDTVQIENRKGGALAVEHLARLGHKKIGILAAALDRPSIHERFMGWKSEMVKHGNGPSEDLVFKADRLNFWGGYERTKEILAKRKDLTALFCVNDEMSAGVLRAARESGRNVPWDLSVVGFDNIIMSHYTDPPLTTISVAKEYMGKLAVSRVLQLIEGGNTKAVRLETPVELIVRESTAKAPARIKA
jgi:DNA-binding LacI/PurR family transcriptional regulator